MQTEINQGVYHQILGQQLLLLPEKAFIWIETATLVIGDLHLGKITHFRKAGIGVPSVAEEENLDRLATLLLNHTTKRVIFLGDLFHSHMNDQWLQFKSFLRRFPELDFILVKGNHDILDPSAYEADNLKIIEHKLIEGPFCFTHHPQENPVAYNIHGHIHPGVVLRGAGLQSLKLPCFHFGAQRLIVPAFGVFTGTAKVNPVEGDNIYAITEEKIIKVL